MRVTLSTKFDSRIWDTLLDILVDIIFELKKLKSFVVSS